MRRTLFILMIIALTFGVVGCATKTTDNLQTVETERIMQESNNRIGMPDINNFYEK